MEHLPLRFTTHLNAWFNPAFVGLERSTKRHHESRTEGNPPLSPSFPPRVPFVAIQSSETAERHHGAPSQLERHEGPLTSRHYHLSRRHFHQNCWDQIHYISRLIETAPTSAPFSFQINHALSEECPPRRTDEIFPAADC